MILMCRQRVADFEAWKAVFDSHVQAQREAGLQLESILRNVDEPGDVLVFFSVHDEPKARAFVSSPDLPDAQARAGLLGPPDIVFLD